MKQKTNYALFMWGDGDHKVKNPAEHQRDTEKKWVGEGGRPLELKRPCKCGCDFREGVKGVGYLIGSDDNGFGVTVWIKDEEVFQALGRILQTKGHSA